MPSGMDLTAHTSTSRAAPVADPPPPLAVWKEGSRRSAWPENGDGNLRVDEEELLRVLTVPRLCPEAAASPGGYYMASIAHCLRCRLGRIGAAHITDNIPL